MIADRTLEIHAKVMPDDPNEEVERFRRRLRTRVDSQWGVIEWQVDAAEDPELTLLRVVGQWRSEHPFRQAMSFVEVIVTTIAGHLVSAEIRPTRVSEEGDRISETPTG